MMPIQMGLFMGENRRELGLAERVQSAGGDDDGMRPPGDLRRSFQLGQWFRQDSMKNAPSVVYRSAGGGIIDA
jgi:hypothetical protein